MFISLYILIYFIKSADSKLYRRGDNQQGRSELRTQREEGQDYTWVLGPRGCGFGNFGSVIWEKQIIEGIAICMRTSLVSPLLLKKKKKEKKGVGVDRKKRNG